MPRAVSSDTFDWHLGGKVVMAQHRLRPHLIEPASSPFPTLVPLEATMKKILLLTGALLALTASLALAAPGLDIAWFGTTTASRCPVGVGAVHDLVDLCDDASVVNQFAMAFKAPAGIQLLVAETFLVDVQTSDPALPAWWHLEDRNDGLGIVRGCRGGEPGFPTSFSYGTTRSLGSTITCKDYWGTSAQPGTTTWNPGVGGPARTRLYGVYARGSASAGALIADTEYYVGTGAIDDNHADPLDPLTQYCNGCLIPACIVFNNLFLQQPAGTPGGDATINTGNLFQSMTWQGGAVGGLGCPAATPTKKATWGQVKSLYR